MTTELRARVAYSLARTRQRWSQRRRPGDPTVVFSMAKSGSSAVAAGLRAAVPGPVHQVHDLDPAFLAEEEAQYRWSGRPWRIWDAQLALERPPTPRAPWRVVSIVRDPIAQTVSAFFQPGVRRGYLRPDTTVDSLLDRFGDRLGHLQVGWYESHLEPALGIDVYATPFDPEAGYQIITTPSVRLLLLRCEGLAAAPRGLAELVGADHPVEIPRVNVGAEKDYAGLYGAFVAALRPSPEVIERAYASRMVRHFYSEAEIAGFRQRWSAGPGDAVAR